MLLNKKPNFQVIWAQVASLIQRITGLGRDLRRSPAPCPLLRLRSARAGYPRGCQAGFWISQRIATLPGFLQVFDNPHSTNISLFGGISYIPTYSNWQPCQWALNLTSRDLLFHLWQPFLLALHIACQIQLQIGFGFPKPTSAPLDSVSIFLLGNLPCFHLQYPSFLWLSLVRSNLFPL